MSLDATMNKDNSLQENDLAVGWIDLSLYGDAFFGKGKMILDQLQGKLNFGSMVALMGPSGSGKSTLLKCINGINTANLSSDTQFYVSNKKEIRTCFIVQDQKDHLLNGLTGYEILIYASKLKNSLYENKDGIEIERHQIDHKKNVLRLMDELMIKDTSKTLVQNCSGGEQKRLSIAIELTTIHKPNLLCIDEPTSGLDSNSSEIVMKCLRKVSRKHNIATVTSIHQPNSDILLMFDQVYALSKGGLCVYSDAPQDIRSFLEECDIECNQYQVPIEVLIKFATKGANDVKVKEMARKNTIENRHKVLNACSIEGTLVHGVQLKSKPFSFVDLKTLILRCATYSLRTQWKANIILFLFINGAGLFMTTLYNNDIGKYSGCFSLEINSNASCSSGVERLREEEIIQQNILFNFFSLVLHMFLLTVATTLTFSSEVRVFLNEHHNGSYSTGAYYWGKSIVELPFYLLIPVVFTCVVFYGSGQLDQDNRFSGFLFIYLMSSLTSQGIGFAIGILAYKSDRLALILTVFWYLVCLLLCDFLVPVDELHQVIQYASNISHMKHIYHSILILIYGLDRCPAGQISIVMFQLKKEDKHLWHNMLWLIFHFIYQRCLALLIMMFNARMPTIKKVSKTKIEKSAKVAPLIQVVEPIVIDFGISKKIDDFNETDQDDVGLLSFAWLQLSFSGKSGLFRPSKPILQELNGKINFGTLTALMGSSGSGKSTLLKCINGLNNSGLSQDTQFYVSQMKALKTAFIVQDQKEHLLMGLTGRETLLYASKLKNSHLEYAGHLIDHKKNVKKLMHDLMIGNTKNTRVDKCSGGEQKRLAIAMELAAIERPNILCLDEPTSGLDSNAAELVVKNLKKVARSNQISIIASIHQPNSDVLMMFDQVYVLAKGGKCIYSDAPQYIRNYLNECEIECTDWQVPVEILLKHATNGIEDNEVKRLITLTLQTKGSLMHACYTEGMPVSQIDKQRLAFSPSDMMYVLMRTARYNFRSQWKVMLSQFIVIVGIGAFYTQLYSKDLAKPDSCIDIYNSFNTSCQKSIKELDDEKLFEQNLKFLLFSHVLMMFLVLSATILTFSSEVKIFLNEHMNGWYSSSSYYFAKSLIELPLLLLITVCYVYATYYLSSQIDETQRFVTYMYFYLMVALCTQGLGFFIGIMSAGDERVAIVVTIGWYIMDIFLCGFFAPIDELPKWMQYLANISFLKHAYQSILLIIYGFDRCPSGQVSSILYQNQLEDSVLFLNAVWIIIHLLIYRVLAFLVLMLQAKPTMRKK